MLFQSLVLAEVGSWFDPSWWFDRLGVLGVIVAAFGLAFRFVLPDLRAMLRSHTKLANTLNVNVPAQTRSLERIERRQEEHGEKLTSIETSLRPRNA